MTSHATILSVAAVLLTVVSSAAGQFSITYFDNYNYTTEQWDPWNSPTTPLDAWDAKYLPVDPEKTQYITAHAFSSIDVFDLRGNLGSQDDPSHGTQEDDWNPLRSIGDGVSGQSPCHVFAALFTGFVYLAESDVLTLESDDDAYVYLDDHTMWGGAILSIGHINYFEAILPYVVSSATAGYHKMTVKFAERRDMYSGIRINVNGDPLVAVREISIDIKPGSYPNSLNINDQGVVPVAILGSADFDVTRIDVGTLCFAGLNVRVKGKQPQCSFEDVSGDFSLSPEGAPDGYVDLVCHFADDATSWQPGETTATLGGALLPQFGGARFAGADEISIRQAEVVEQGTISWEVWLNVEGALVTDLTGHINYPAHPSFRDRLASFETPSDWSDNYGTRVHGFLHPQTSGAYTFWIASDDQSELWLSTDDDPANAKMIANVPGWTPARDFDNERGGVGNAEAQKSDPIWLQAGRKYYIMALQKEAGGQDNLAVAWQGPDCLARDIIGGAFLSPAE